MQTILILLFLALNSNVYCADDQNDLTDYHERVATNALQLQTSDIHILKQMGTERYQLIAQANGQYMAKTSVYQNYKLALEDKQRLIRDLEITRERIRTSSDLQQALFAQVQSLLSMHVELLPELYAHKIALDVTRQERMVHMSQYEIQQYTDMLNKLNQEFQIAYISTLDAWLSRSQEALTEEVSAHDCRIS